MRLLIQRVKNASVSVGGDELSRIGQGLLVLVGVGVEDTDEDMEYLAGKLVRLRIFDDGQGVMNLDVRQVGGEVLVVSQFTLYGDCHKGRRPNFLRAAPPDIAIPLYEQFLRECEALGFPPQHGEFGAYMQVASENDGPVTLIVDTNDLK